MGVASQIKADTPVQFLKGIGPRRASALSEIGVETLEEFLLVLPRRYEDRGAFQSIGSLKPNDVTGVIVTVLSCGVRRTRRPGFQILEVAVEDESGQLRAVFMNQVFLKDVFKNGQRVLLYGKVEQRGTGGLQFTNPDYEVVEGSSQNEETVIHMGRVVPIYEKIGSLTPKLHRRVVYQTLQSVNDAFEDRLPVEIQERLGYPSKLQAVTEAHFPQAGTGVKALNEFRTMAQERLIFEEFFFFQAGLSLRRRELHAEAKAHSIAVDDRIRASALEVLPFRLTGDQRAALKEIVSDLTSPEPMRRLLQGDVGSGKTIVSILAALVVMENDLQVVLMAPTELLAEQHFSSLKEVLGRSRFGLTLLTGATSAKDRRRLTEDIANGSLQFVVGTHALLQEDIMFRRLGLVVIDEQHRFGVAQRAALGAKGNSPDILVMTATPIPRTLALTVYGDLDVSNIRELPPGRKPILTTVHSGSVRSSVYDLVRGQLDKGRQAYVVCPLVEESEKLDLKAATQLLGELKAQVFPDKQLELVHGRINARERERIMQLFVTGDVDILVATTVIEVGVDVPNATVMVIEQAERFGLAQLHQLRGRVGRGRDQSFCVLLHGPRMSDLARARLHALEQSNDGFVIAEQDLDIRGPGDFFGTRQSGMPFFRVGNVIRDHTLMEQAKRHAGEWLESGKMSAVDRSMLRDKWESRFAHVGTG
jgi:ATP-dependent DNA helicase RecG